MTFEQFWAMVSKRWQIILICFLIVGLGTFIGSKLMKPLYQSSALVQVAGEVSSTTKLNTQLFEIDVVDPNPTRAADLANDIAVTLIKQQLQAIQRNNAQSRQQIQQNLDQTRHQIDAITSRITALQ